MSKAMDALELVWRIMCDGGDSDAESLATACATLRDYITTTEAERGKSSLALATDIGIKYMEYAKRIIDVDPRELVAHLIDSDRSAQRQLGRDESAARIKELEEAIDCAMGSIARSNLQRAVEYLSATVVISGARKVGP